MKRIYVAGPMTGIKNLNYPAFHDAAARLRARGFEVINPAEINTHADAAEAEETDPQVLAAHWRRCMRRDIAELVTCDAIAMLPGWERSKGARLERHNAIELGMEVMLLDQPEVELA